jgi:hypothetical protein
MAWLGDFLVQELIMGHYPTLKQLRISQAEGCRLCALLLPGENVGDCYQELGSQSYRIQVRRFQENSHDQYGDLKVLFQLNTTSEVVLHFRAKAMHQIMERSKAPPDMRCSIWSRSTASPRTFEQARNWLSECLKSHSVCRGGSTSLVSDFGTDEASCCGNVSARNSCTIMQRC